MAYPTHSFRSTPSSATRRAARSTEERPLLSKWNLYFNWPHISIKLTWLWWSESCNLPAERFQREYLSPVQYFDTRRHKNRSGILHILYCSKKTLRRIPFRAILTTVPIWAVWIGSLGNFAAVELMFLYNPTYMKKGMTTIPHNLLECGARYASTISHHDYKTFQTYLGKFQSYLSVMSECFKTVCFARKEPETWYIAVLKMTTAQVGLASALPPLIQFLVKVLCGEQHLIQCKSGIPMQGTRILKSIENGRGVTSLLWYYITWVYNNRIQAPSPTASSSSPRWSSSAASTPSPSSDARRVSSRWLSSMRRRRYEHLHYRLLLKCNLPSKSSSTWKISITFLHHERNSCALNSKFVQLLRTGGPIGKKMDLEAFPCSSSTWSSSSSARVFSAVAREVSTRRLRPCRSSSGTWF